jgi:hypothetical protein
MLSGNSGREAVILRLAATQPNRVIVNTINGLIATLKRRGVEIEVFGDKTKTFHGFKTLGNHTYCMILAKSKTEVSSNANSDPPGR